jgi:hypothetical protein
MFRRHLAWVRKPLDGGRPAGQAGELQLPITSLNRQLVGLVSAAAESHYAKFAIMQRAVSQGSLTAVNWRPAHVSGFSQSHLQEVNQAFRHPVAFERCVRFVEFGQDSLLHRRSDSMCGRVVIGLSWSSQSALDPGVRSRAPRMPIGIHNRRPDRRSRHYGRSKRLGRAFIRRDAHVAASCSALCDLQGGNFA